MDITLKVKENVQNIIEENGYILDDVLYEKEGKTNCLTLVIDKNGIITVDDCVEVTKLVNPILDEINVIEESYVLDVCSKEKGCE